jgi:sirohydrochlorin cobaltochelatase
VRGIVLFAHGARDPEWARPFEAIRDRVRASRPEYPIALAYLEIMTPTLEEAIASLVAEGASAITVFPLFMAQGGHLRQDLPRILDAIRASQPHVPISLESAVGEVPGLLDAIAAWILERAGG